jgi:hypothetical protein
VSKYISRFVPLSLAKVRKAKKNNAYMVVKEREHHNRIASIKHLFTQLIPQKKVEKLIGDENIY